MIVEVLVFISLLLNALVLVLLLTQKLGPRVSAQVQHQMEPLAKAQETVLNTLRASLAESRTEAAQQSFLGREELASQVQQWSHTVQQAFVQYRDHMQQTQQMANQEFKATHEQSANRFETFFQEQSNAELAHHRNTVAAIIEASRQQKDTLDSFAKQLVDLTAVNENKLEGIRQAVESKLSELRADNAAKLEQMRATVEEKLHQTLETRLSESFRLVSDRLEQVQKGLGEMQHLASGVGDLKKVLSNVKARGTLGEIQLDHLLEQTLSHDQYQRSVATSDRTQERVDFAIKLPGKSPEDGPVWLPIDAKFPVEDYQRLIEAEEADDRNAAAEAGRALELRLRSEAKSISDKYLSPPNTTDFALMFLPIEGLYAEVLRRPGLWEGLQRDYHIIVTGPTTISAILNSFQMGFRTIAIEQRSSEVWKLLGSVKTEFGKFGAVLQKTQKKLQEASNTIDSAAVRSRAIERRLREVEALPGQETEALVLTDSAAGESDPD